MYLLANKVYTVVLLRAPCQPVISFLVCELCQPVATSSYPYIPLNSERYLQKFLFIVLFKACFNKKLLHSALQALMVDASYQHLHQRMVSNSYFTPPPQSSPQRSKGPSPDNFLTTAGCFKQNTSCVKALRWLEKKKEEI